MSLDWVIAISTIVLVVVTAFYARETRRIAQKTEALAEATDRIAVQTENQASETRTMVAATQKSVEQTHQQYLNATLPLVVFRLRPGPNAPSDRPDPVLSLFIVELYNAGSGPALDLKFQIDGPPIRAQLCRTPATEGAAGPHALGHGRAIQLAYREDKPLEWTDGLIVGWLSATYRDVHGRAGSSRAELVYVLIPAEVGRGPSSRLRLGAMTLELPDV